MDRPKAMPDFASEAEGQLLAGIEAVQTEFLDKVRQAYTDAVQRNGELLRAYQRLILDGSFPKPFNVAPVPSTSGETSKPIAETEAEPTAPELPKNGATDNEVGKRTAREIALDVIRGAGKPIRWDQVIAAITAEGLKEASAKKIRTKLTQDGTISFKGDLCTLTSEAQQRFRDDNNVDPV